MANEIPSNLFKQVNAIFKSFDKDGDGVIKGDEVVQNNSKRYELGQGSIYKIKEDMDINSFYKENRSIFMKDENKYRTHNYNELEAESQFREADENSDGKISRKEAKKAKKNEKIGELFKPHKGETMEEYKSRVLPELKRLGYIKKNEDFERLFKLTDWGL